MPGERDAKNYFLISFPVYAFFFSQLIPYATFLTLFTYPEASLDGVSRDEEGLVDGRIDRGSGLTRVGSDGGRVDLGSGSLDRGVGAGTNIEAILVNTDCRMENKEDRERNSHIDLSGLGLTGD